MIHDVYAVSTDAISIISNVIFNYRVESTDSKSEWSDQVSQDNHTKLLVDYVKARIPYG
jgi:hypothetical protein